MGSQLPGPYWSKARRTGANWVLPSVVQGANSISGDSKLPRLTSCLIIYCLLLGKGPLFAYSFMILLQNLLILEIFLKPQLSK